MDRVSITSLGAVWQARQKQNGLSPSVFPDSSLLTSQGDFFHSTQKSAVHFAGPRGKEVERAKDGEQSTLYTYQDQAGNDKAYIWWQGNYLTQEEYQEVKAKNDAIWASLRAEPVPSTAQPTAHKSAESSTQQYIEYKGAYLTPEEYQLQKAKDDAIWERLMAGSAEETQEGQSGYPIGLEGFSGLSMDDPAATSSKSGQHDKGKKLQRGVSQLKPEEKHGPRRSVSPLKEEDYDTEDGEESRTKHPGYIKWGNTYLSPDEYQDQLAERRLQQEASARQRGAELEGRSPGSIKQPKAQHPRRPGKAPTQTILEEAFNNSSTKVGDYLPDSTGRGWWRKVKPGNREQPYEDGVYEFYPHDNQQAGSSTEKKKKGGVLDFFRRRTQ